MKEINREDQINSIFETIISIAQLDYSRKAIISDNSTQLDAIAAGINMLSEQMEHLFIEQKQVENKLKEQTTLLNKSQEISHLGSWMLDVKANNLIWSDEVYRIFGLRPQEFEANYEAFLEAVHPEDRVMVDDAYLNSVKNGSDGYEIEHRLIRRDTKETRCVLEKCVHEKDTSGNIIRSIGFVHDVTERKATEESLKQSLKELSDYKYALDESSIVAVTDQKGIIKYVNENFCKISKYSREELLGQDHRIVNSGYHSQEFMQDLWQTIANCKIWRGEIKNKAKDGTLYWVDTNIIPFINEKGKPYQYLSIRRDITAQKKAEEKLIELNNQLENRVAERTRESENQKKYYKALIENSSDAILLINFKGRIVYQSPSGRKINGFTQSETNEKPAIEFIHPDDIPDYKALMKKLLGRHGVPFTRQYRMKHKNGHFIWVEGTVTNQLNDEIINGFIVNYRDITERREAELRISYSELRLNKAQEIAHLGSWERNLITNEVLWSDEIYRIFELNKEHQNASYDVYTNLIHPDDKKRIDSIYSESVRKRKPYTADYRFLFPDGKIKYLEEQCETMFDKSGIPLKSFGTIQDITDRKEAEMAVYKSESQLKKAQEIAHIGSWELSFATNQAIWSDEACRIYGLPIDQNIQTYEQWLAFIHPDDFEHAMKLIDESQRTISDSSIEHRIVLKNGEVKYVNSVSKFQFDQNGNPVGLFGITHDITEIKKAEKSLKESEIKYQGLFENMLDGVYKSSPEGKFFDVNPAMVKMLGYDRKEELMSININKDLYFDEADREMARKQEESGKVAVIKLKKKDGTEIWAEDRGHYVLDENGNLLYNEGILRDVTERVEAEKERNRVAADLVLKNKDLEQFAYIVSHNLRAPVANIIGITDILKNPDLPDDLKMESTKGLFQSANKLDDVIRDLNTILQVRGQINEYKELVSFSSILSSIKNSIDSIIDNTEAEIHFDFSEIDEIKTVKSYIYSIFYNLIINSIKFKKESVKPIIEIQSKLYNDTVVISIKDNGIGFDLARQKEHIFGLYKRFNPDIEGKGVGLYMVKQQVESLGGTIELNSELGKGAEFKIELKRTN